LVAVSCYSAIRHNGVSTVSTVRIVGAVDWVVAISIVTIAVAVVVVGITIVAWKSVAIVEWIAVESCAPIPRRRVVEIKAGTEMPPNIFGVVGEPPDSIGIRVIVGI